MVYEGVDVLTQNIENNPCCPHGPTILFCRTVNGVPRKYFACSACRDRKQCNFFLWEDEKSKFNEKYWAAESQKFIKFVKHREMFGALNKFKSVSNTSERSFCNTCNILHKKGDSEHINHSVINGLTDYQLTHPSDILPALNNSKKEAQYHFSKSSVGDIITIFKCLGFKNVICLGTPRIHEHIQNNYGDMTSILLDIDKRFHNFFGPLSFCWYNMFNNHFFIKEAKEVFKTYLQTHQGKNMVLITDPPFGGRTEILSTTFKTINKEYKTINKIQEDLPIFWIYPYYMEPQILNSMSEFSMLDYKVEYDNHQSFQSGPKGRKKGSPVRVFTNVNPSLIQLPSPNYKLCNICNRWVANENKHCNQCNTCTSKNGDTYVHCNKCDRCVKPTWKHCKICNRCAQALHNCEQMDFVKECFNCKVSGHKKVDCPLLKGAKPQKRKNNNVIKTKKKKKKS